MISLERDFWTGLCLQKRRNGSRSEHDIETTLNPGVNEANGQEIENKSHCQEMLSGGSNDPVAGNTSRVGGQELETSAASSITENQTQPVKEENFQVNKCFDVY